VLSAFDGTILLVSHDRYLINKLAQQIWQIEDGRLRVFRGTYAEWQSARRSQPRPAPRVEKPAPPIITPGPSAQPSKNADRKRRDQIEALETQIAAQEAKILEIERAIAAVTGDNGAAKTVALSSDYAAAKKTLDALLEEWAQHAG
jgi:ATP-binding cassette, subfamily F, member 3